MRFSIARGLSMLASLCALIWINELLFELGLPSLRANTPDSEAIILMLVGVDVFLFLVGLAAVAAAMRNRMRTGLAAMIVLTPLLHLIASTGVQLLFGLDFAVPLIAILVMSANPEYAG